jgi:hypothetical protein
MTFTRVHSISQWQKRSRSGSTPQIRATLQDSSITNNNQEKEQVGVT